VKRIFITGIAGFIGFHLAKKLHSLGIDVIGIDNFNAYYDPHLKKKRASLLEKEGIKVYAGDITTPGFVEEHLAKQKTTHLVHLAAQAGVRYSLDNPYVFSKTNVDGFTHILEALKKQPHCKLIFASSSSVYGKQASIPFKEEEKTDQPLNLYGATKKANEVMAYAYHHLYHIPMIGLRFFTAYGPWGRPDMAYFTFTDAILQQKPIKLHNFGHMERDFTYIDDIIDGTIKALDFSCDFSLFNLGRGEPLSIVEMVRLIEKHLGIKASIDKLPMQLGEIKTTYASIDKANHLLGYTPKTSLENGLAAFISWYHDHYAQTV
jgi:UDP-glucuronate 4-epimerase